MLNGRKILLGVCGGVAAYKAAFLARELQRRGAKIKVAMTRAAREFIGPSTFAGLLGEPPVLDLWDASRAGEVHIDLANWLDAIVVAPATANLMAKMVGGFADDALAATLLASDRPVLLAPAMHHRMWNHRATAANVEALRERRIHFVGPLHGPLASGEEGIGRMAEPDAIADALEVVFAQSGRDLRGLRLLVTAGPTHEPLDPVRFLGNRSSGKMGYAIAERARRRGARVTLISGPVSLPAPREVEFVTVKTAAEMQSAIDAHVEKVDAVVMAAAVADWRAAEISQEKSKKRDEESERAIALVRNPDILAGLGERRALQNAARPVLIGFAVETDRLLEAARQKLVRKKVDLIVANHAQVAFEGDQNDVTLVSPSGDRPLGLSSKTTVADHLLDWLRDHLEAEAIPNEVRASAPER